MNFHLQVVNLKEARDFSTNTGFIYLFKKLEWEALSIDLLPHPDMFTEANLARSEEANLRDEDGAKRVFFGGERFLEGISGQAYVNICFRFSFTCTYDIKAGCNALDVLVPNSLALMVASCSDHGSENSTKQSTWA
jgi:hypothetical protein